jgi:hypothetical protein
LKPGHNKETYLLQKEYILSIAGRYNGAGDGISWKEHKKTFKKVPIYRHAPLEHLPNGGCASRRTRLTNYTLYYNEKIRRIYRASAARCIDRAACRLFAAKRRLPLIT